jgi:GNAT superfamily N-acetyltransferase
MTLTLRAAAASRPCDLLHSADCWNGRAPLSPVFKSALAAWAEIWDAGGGIDDAHSAIMARAAGPKPLCWAAFMTPAGCVGAILDGNAVLRAIETAHAFRRQGLGPYMESALAFWAQERRAHGLSAGDKGPLRQTRSQLPSG